MKITESCRKFGLSFSAEADEVAFKSSQEPKLIFMGAVCDALWAVVLLLILLPSRISEGHQEHGESNPSSTSQTPLFICHFSLLALILVILALSAMRLWRGWLRRLDWEIIFLFIGCCSPVLLLLTMLYKDTCAERLGVAPIGLTMAMTCAQCMLVPIRTSRLWVVPLSVGVSLSVVAFERGGLGGAGLANCFTGNPDNGCTDVPLNGAVLIEQLLALGGILAQLSLCYWAAWQSEHCIRTDWMADEMALRSRVQPFIDDEDESPIHSPKSRRSWSPRGSLAPEHSDTLSTILHGLGDVTMYLTSDLCVYGTDPLRDAYFSQSVEGQIFTSMLVPEDELLLLKRLKKVAGPHCMPVTFQQGYGVNKAKIAMVEISSGGASYMIGFSILKDEHGLPLIATSSCPQSFANSIPTAMLSVATSGRLKHCGRRSWTSGESSQSALLAVNSMVGLPSVSTLNGIEVPSSEGSTPTTSRKVTENSLPPVEEIPKPFTSESSGMHEALTLSVIPSTNSLGIAPVSQEESCQIQGTCDDHQLLYLATHKTTCFDEDFPCRPLPTRRHTVKISSNVDASTIDVDESTRDFSPTRISFGARSHFAERSSFGGASVASFCYTESSLAPSCLPRSHLITLDASVQTAGAWPECFEKSTEAGTQTEGTVSQTDQAVETWIVWERDGFKCKRCSKPPVMPSFKQAQTRQRNSSRRRRSEGSPRSSSSCSRVEESDTDSSHSLSSQDRRTNRTGTGGSCSSTQSSTAGSSSKSQGPTKSQLSAGCSSSMPTTSDMGRCVSLQLFLRRWIIERDAKSCCPWHTAVQTCIETSQVCLETSCDPLFSTMKGWQCNRCGILCPNSTSKCTGCTRFR